MLGRPEHRGQRADLALAEAVVEAEVGQPLPQAFQDRHRHDRGSVVRLPQRAQLTHREVRVGGQADPYRRRGEEAVRLPRLDQVEDALRDRRVHDRVPGPHRQVRQQEDVHLRRVVERQRVDGPVVLGQVQGLDRALVLVHESPVGHHRALRQGGGPRGVEELDQCARVPVAVEGQWLGQLRQEGVGGVAQRPHPVPVGDPPDQVGIGEDQGARGVVQDVREVLAGEVLVDRDMDEPGPRAGEVGEEVGVRVVGEGGDPVPCGQCVPLPQQGGAGGDGGVEFRVRPTPLAVVHGRAVGDPPRNGVHQSVDRVVAHHPPCLPCLPCPPCPHAPRCRHGAILVLRYHQGQ